MTLFFRGATAGNIIGGIITDRGWTKKQLDRKWIGRLRKKSQPKPHWLTLRVTEVRGTREPLPGCVRVAAFLQLVMPLRMGILKRGLEQTRADAEIFGRAALESGEEEYKDGGDSDLEVAPSQENRQINIHTPSQDSGIRSGGEPGYERPWGEFAEDQSVFLVSEPHSASLTLPSLEVTMVSRS
jgi:hypothetical protein